MSTIDERRISAVSELEELGYTFDGGQWMQPDNGTAGPPALDADALYAPIIKRADDLVGCAEGADDQLELGAISGAIEACVALRWPYGRTDGGKG
jgi:hypothetical protein